MMNALLVLFVAFLVGCGKAAAPENNVEIKRAQVNACYNYPWQFKPPPHPRAFVYFEAEFSGDVSEIRVLGPVGEKIFKKSDFDYSFTGQFPFEQTMIGFPSDNIDPTGEYTFVALDSNGASDTTYSHLKTFYDCVRNILINNGQPVDSTKPFPVVWSPPKVMYGDTTQNFEYWISIMYPMMDAEGLIWKLDSAITDTQIVIPAGALAHDEHITPSRYLLKIVTKCGTTNTSCA